MLSAIVVEERQTLIGENKHNKSRRLFFGCGCVVCAKCANRAHTNLISMHPKLIPNFRVNIVDYFHIERIAIIIISHAFTSANANGNGNI